MDIRTESSGKHTPLENRKSSNMTSLNTTSSHWMSSDDTMPSEDNGKDTVKVQGVVVKLRKKVARNVEPGGGHEAVPSRRMKKGLCGLGRENSSGQFIHAMFKHTCQLSCNSCSCLTRT